MTYAKANRTRCNQLVLDPTRRYRGRDVILVPPGSIKVAGDDEKLYAVRISESGQTATLNGAIVSKGTGALTYGLLFQDDSSLDQDGNIQFYTGKAQIEVVVAPILEPAFPATT